MKKNTKKVIAEVGAGIAVAAAATAAGAYFLYGKDGVKNRKKVRGWMLKAKGEVLEKLEKAKDFSEPIYNDVVDQVNKKYAAMQNVDKQELAQMIKELRGHWQNISRQVKGSQKSPSKRVSTKRKNSKKTPKTS